MLSFGRKTQWFMFTTGPIASLWSAMQGNTYAHYTFIIAMVLWGMSILCATDNYWESN